MKQYIVFYTLLFILGLSLGFLQVNMLFAILIILLFVVIFLSITFYPVLVTKDVEKTEDYLKSHQKNPVYHLYYAIGNKFDAEVEEAFSRALVKYKNPNRAAIFHVIYSLYKDDLDHAKKYLELIPQKSYHLYYYAAILIEENNLEEAENVAKELTGSQWMQAIIFGEIALKRGQQDAAKQQIERAFNKTRGLQRYSIYKQYQQLLEK